MKVAVVSDIHGNYHALEAVLAEVTAEEPDEVWCLGDIVGYGPDPNGCVALVAERASVSLAGNHDLAVLGSLAVDGFNADAAAAVRWTQEVLDPRARGFLADLSSLATREEAALFHGSPVDPVWDYVLSGEGARQSFARVDAPLILVGHSHIALALSGGADAVTGGLAREGDKIDLSGARWLLNPGSVGQPRGGDPRASWLLLDLSAGWAGFRRTEYPIEKTQAAIRSAGLPASLANRLRFGQ